MADPRTQLMTFPLTLGMDNVSHPELVQPVGARPRVVRSMNTRLTKVPGIASKAPDIGISINTLTSMQGGVIPAGLTDSTLLPDSKISVPVMRRMVRTALANAVHYTAPPAVQSMYYPAQVVRAGVLPGSNTSVLNASAAYSSVNAWTYYVTIQRYQSVSGVFLAVLGDDGREIVTSQLLLSFTTPFDNERNFAAVSVHGAVAVLWYADGASPQLRARTIAINTSTLAVSLGAPVVVHTAVGGVFPGPALTQISYDLFDTSNAYVICLSAADATKFTVLRVAVPGLTFPASYTSPALSGALVYLAISYCSQAGLIAAAHAAGGKINEYELNPTSLAEVWSLPAQLEDGQPSCGFELSGALVRRVFAVSRTAAGQRGTLVEWRDAVAGALVASGLLKHQTMVGQIVTMYSGLGGEVCCLFTTQVCYRPNLPMLSYDPIHSPTIGSNFVPDPSIEVFRLGLQVAPGGAAALLPSCVARLGTDLAIRYPGALNPFDPGGVNPNRLFIQAPLSCLCVNPGRALITYLQENTVEGNVAMGYSVRHALLSFEALQPRFAHTGEGATIVAGALPAVWDGARLTEFSPIRQTSISVDTTGVGPAFPAGAYLFAAVITWVDAQGQLHRSAPSNIVSQAMPGALAPTVYVRLPDSYRNAASQPGFQVVLYVSEVNGTVLYANPAWLNIASAALYSADYATLSNIPLPVVDAFHPAIYTDGSATQPLAAFCPNACLDVAVIADRAWMLDAERPGRWWFSKPKEAGVFFEMSPDLYLDTPSNAGNGIALSEWQGNPVFLTSKGIWATAGEGPDALAQPPNFAAAVQVSDVACTQRLSVVKTPVGVMFVADNRFARFSGQMVSYPEIHANAHGAIVGTAIFRDEQEVCWFTSDGHVFVYNWIVDAFTLWDTTVTRLASMTGAAQRADGQVVMVNSNAIHRMDPTRPSTNAQIEIATGHVSLGDKSDNNLLENIVLHARRHFDFAHGLTITVLSDYGSAELDTKTRTAAEVTASTNSENVYDIVLEPAQQAARAVQVTLTETGATFESFQPISLTFEVIKKPGKAWRNVPESARV